MLSRLAITFLPSSKCLLVSCLQSSSVVTLEPPQIKSVTVSIVSHLLVMKWWDRMPWFFWILSFKPTFSLSSYTFIKRLFSYHMTFYKRQKSKAQRTNQLFTRLALGQVGGWWYKEITLVLPIFCTLFAEKVTRTFFMNA